MSPLNIIRENILVKRNLALALRDCRQLLVEKQEAGKGQRAMELYHRLEAIEEDYMLMRDYMLRGYEDKSREEVYIQLLRRCYRLWADLSLCVLINGGGNAYADAASNSLDGMSPDEIRNRLEGFVQETAILALTDSEHEEERRKTLLNSHEQFLSQLFNLLMSSFQWKSGDAEFYKQLLLLPTIDTQDACILVSAIMLSCMRTFDAYKWLTLVHVYEHTEDEYLRQRSLVGWVLSLSGWPTSIFPEYERAIARLTDSEEIRQELLEMQKQMFFCMNADRDNETIQRDIMPSLLKNGRLNITRHGIEEIEESSLEDILNPDAEEKAMEAVEQSMRKMADMQKAGGDIYFGGFAHMKRFSFFFTLSHWFTPFSLDHPALNHIPGNLIQSAFMKGLLKKGCFCDSDKYSFALAIPNVISRLPKDMRDMMESAEGVAMIPDEEQPCTPTFIRRMYLQDLFRFFRLYTRKDDFRNPFGSATRAPRIFFLNSAFKETALSQTVSSLCQFLYKHHWLQYIEPLMSMHVQKKSFEDLLVLGAVMLEQEKLAEAKEYYGQGYALNPANKQVLRGMAKTHFLLHEYEAAESYYQELSFMTPESVSTQLNLALTMIHNEKAEESLPILFKLQYEHPEHAEVKRVLAWNLLVLKRPAEAADLYRKLADNGDSLAVDSLNMGYALWFQGLVAEAVASFQQYKTGEESIMTDFENDRQLLERYEKNDVDLHLMADTVDFYSL